MSQYDEDENGSRRDAKQFGAASPSERHISRDHKAAQRVVCCVCFRKGNSFRNITAGKEDETGNYLPGMKDHIKDLVFSDFDAIQWAWLPTVICGKCRLNLKSWKEKKANGER